MAGSHPYRPNFGTEFRDSIERVQLMAMPKETDLRPRFTFPDPVRDESVYGDVDETGVPLDLDADPEVDPLPARQADVRPLFSVIEVGGGPEDAVSIGDFDPDRHELMFLDRQWELIDGWETVVIGGDIYVRDRELTPRAIYDVTLHRLLVKTPDAT